ncbi:hypothetical protein GEMRC1_012254 [Eukaryota sp. GEM-RC1]
MFTNPAHEYCTSKNQLSSNFSLLMSSAKFAPKLIMRRWCSGSTVNFYYFISSMSNSNPVQTMVRFHVVAILVRRRSTSLDCLQEKPRSGPGLPIVVVSPTIDMLRKLNIVFGVRWVHCGGVSNFDELPDAASEYALNSGFAMRGG